MIHTARAETTVPSTMTFMEARIAYEPIVFGYVSRRIRPREEAEDIAAQVFVDAYVQWRRLRGAPKYWLLGIARRKVCDALRKQRRLWSLQEGDAQACALGGYMAATEVRQAVAIVMQLPDDQRDAFLLQVLEDMPIDEIAQVMARTHASVNSLLQRARTRIQRTLDVQNREGLSS